MIRDLGNGLVLRRATARDVEALVAFNADIHRDYGAPEPDAAIAVWTRDLGTRPHPTFSVSDFLIVEDAATGAIASSLSLISQTWSYDGIEFGVGRPELVGTAPAWRRRGLVRLQFDEIHAWSAARGELAQAITGIPWYYRQFGYEYAIELEGGRTTDADRLPKLAAGAAEPYHVRPATAADLPFIARLDDLARRRYLVTCVRDAALWRCTFDRAATAPIIAWMFRIVTDADGVRIGYVAHSDAPRGGTLVVRALELTAGTPWPTVMPSVLRYLAATAAATATGAVSRPTLTFLFGTQHPAYVATPDALDRVREPYAWYVRVPDLPAFVRRIAPALERRLSASVAAGYSGELRLNFFRAGLRLAFARGRLIETAPWPEAHDDTADASFPDLTFHQLVFGYRSLDELRHAYPDCRVWPGAAAALLDALFPKWASWVWEVS